MLKRTITGGVYVAIIVAFFLLRKFVDYRFFDILIWFLCAVGTFELSRALINKTGKIFYYVNSIYGILVVPLFFIVDNVALGIKPYTVVLLIALALIFIYAIINAFQKEVYITKFLWQSLALIYPTVLLIMLMLISRAIIGNGEFFLILTFVISPCTDVMAYLVGMIYNKIKKGQAKKLCPKLSPKKTIAGAIGGLIGGVLGGVILYFIVNPSLNTSFPLLIIILLGIVTSVISQVGDLFESFIKRSVGIKDMGKIMPGHGGVMDRIDGTLFTIPFFLIASMVL